MVRTPEVALVPGGVNIVLASPLSPEETSQRVRSLVADRISIEIAEPGQSRRRLLGSVDGSAVHLVVRDDRIWTRRKSWNVEFVGEIIATPTGSALRGTIDVPDRQMLDYLMWTIRLGAIGIAVLIVAFQARAGLDPGTVAYGAFVAAFPWFVTVRMRSIGLKFAAEDAALVERQLRNALGS